MLRDLATVSSECTRYGMPLFVMTYVRGEQVRSDRELTDMTAHAARVCTELGADMIKICYPNDAADFKDIVESCEIPIIIAGGDKCNIDTLCSTVKQAMTNGASGISIGRNLFQSECILSTMKKLHPIVHGIPLAAQ